jgi:glutamyl-tRNA synthetase
MGQTTAELGDAIIRRSDGQPLYNLAVVVDDLDMEITHVLRGADHQINTAIQIAIYQALEREPPHFAHVPLIVGSGGKKLSKRRDPVSIQDFRTEGYLPDAMCNWLVRIGWSHGDQELFTKQEIRELFDLPAVHRASAQADVDKLQWLDQQHIKAMQRDDLLEALRPFLAEVAGRDVEPSPGLAMLVDLLRERSKTLREMATAARFLVVDEIRYDDRAASKHLKPAIEPVLRDLHDHLEGLESWDESSLEAVFDDVRGRHGDLAMGKLAQPVRVAVTGGAVSPPIFETLVALGKARSVGRLAEAVHFLRHG